MKINVVGIGRLGICTALCLAKVGHDVVGIDIDKKMVESINNKKAYYIEPQVQEYLDTYPIKATTDYKDAAGEVSFIITPTPSKEDKTFDDKYVIDAIIKLCDVLPKDKYHLFNIVSTVMPGTCEKIYNLIKKIRGNDSFGLTYNPEFIAQGSIINDFQQPDMILIGESDTEAGERLKDIYYPQTHRIKCMSLWNAEVTKIALNSYTTMKVNFANLLAEICEKIPEGDVDKVTDAIGSDSRIGKKYLKGATAYGGPCFPRDNLAFDVFCKSINVDAKIARDTHEMNEQQIMRLVEKIMFIDNKNQKITILGVSYKPNTPITEQSASLKLKRELEACGFSVAMYDEFYKKDGELLDVLTDSSLCIIMLPCKEFEHLDLTTMKYKRVLDCWRLLDKYIVESLWNAEYHAIGVADD